MRLLQALALLCLLAASALAQATDILVAASNDTPALQRFVDDLATRRPDDRVRFVHTSALTSPESLPADSRLVLLGADALDWRLGTPGGPPTLVMQISRVQAFRRLGDSRPPHLTLLWSDPAPSRQLRLIRQLLPQARRVGLLYGDDSRFLVNELRRLAAAQGLAITTWYWPDTRDSRPLNRLLDGSDVLLGVDDPALYNPGTIKGVLLASYGRRLALIGPTAAFIRAGSLSSSYSDQQDWLNELDRLLSLAPQHWPREAYPQHFKVLSNPQVARSLGVELSDDRDQALRLQQWESLP
ncbi:ABC transporter substrate-binding protein [Pseudomonas sp. A-1]|jgi:hypothetical protein|uniref:ABC transporter substrate-binding protein n=1 Tax=unclassified Pseudomonas TaxID=196821 RepID=UPI0010A5F9A1|nr:MULTISPECIES: ABC transporter substrate-binding protein [unclassified Pseudomonas]THG84475.1 ABC transporter substrate-binding protein [Pseudomonas sp. A-1]WPP46166.1 ABC transporter substrate-binding protein [Pseudomonas sp. AN-1]